eukprot:TRINITY_DN6769_c0_g1_i1.p1 TRINITY_DN6769_c0_g1~~TRINITY_DN6769_c0_g1_i1.p1  ORF type:complete len:886 (-),score=154.22 TRINITY_DN6769_c0_g1_i1:250-2907(-)
MDRSEELTNGELRLRMHDEGWQLLLPGLCIEALPPKLHGSVGPTRWNLELPFSRAAFKQQQVQIQNIGELPCLVAQSREPCKSNLALHFTWSLTLALHEKAGLLLAASVELEDSPDMHDHQVVLEHLCLAPFKICQEKAPGEEPDVDLSRRTAASNPSCSSCTSWSNWRRLLHRVFRGAPAPCRGPRHSSLLVNGWQSFGFSGMLHGAVGQPRTVTPYFSGAFHAGASLPVEAEAEHQDGVLVSDMFGLFLLHSACDRDAEGGGLLGGFLRQVAGFGGLAAYADPDPCRLLLFADVGVHLTAGARFTSDWALLQLLPKTTEGNGVVLANKCLHQYFACVAKHNGIISCKAQPTGWCSWYCHGPKVDEKLMLSSLRELMAMGNSSGELPLKLFQLDDGWQSAWGDWLTPNPARFPQGLKPLAKSVCEAGLTPGLWLAPAALVADSALAKEHPGWLLRDTFGRPMKCGFTAPGLWMLALDTTHPEVLEHIHNVICTMVHNWGFSYLKCDFLHCAAMPGAKRHDPSISRAAALGKLVETIRKAAGPDTFILACGAPLGPCIGHVDAVRVSADTAEHWLPKGPDMPGFRWFFARDRTNLPAARNMVCSTLARLPMQGTLWVNDPDCLILREDVALGEAQALATVAALSAGSLIFSDHLAHISPDRLNILKAMLPPLPHAAQQVELLRDDIPGRVCASFDAALGSWQLFGVFHWTDGAEECELDLPLPPAPQGWHIFEFWSSSYRRHQATDPVLLGKLLPRHCCLLAVRQVNMGRAQFVGSDIHVSCGLEVTSWQQQAMAEGSTPAYTLEFFVKAGRVLTQSWVWLFLPGSSQKGCQPKLIGSGSTPMQEATNNPSEDVTCNQGQQVSDEVWKLPLPRVPLTGRMLRVDW